MEARVKSKLKWYEKFTHIIVTSTESLYYESGKFVGKKPLITILISWMVVFASTLGFAYFYEEKNPVRLWIPKNSNFIKDSDILINTFETIFRQESMQVVSKNVLTPEVLMEVYEISMRVKNVQTGTGVKWSDICIKIPKINRDFKVMYQTKRNNSNSMDFDPSIHIDTNLYCQFVESLEKECFQRNILDIWDQSFDKIRLLTKSDIINSVNNIEEDDIFKTNFKDLLGGITYNASGSIVAAKSLSIYWMTQFNFSAVHTTTTSHTFLSGDWASIECLEWEKEFLKIMEKSEKLTKYCQTFYSAARSFPDISGNTMFQDLYILCCGILIMTIFVQFVISKFNMLELRLLVGCMGIVSVAMAFVITCGLCSLFGMFYGPVHTSLPFLLMGLGVDDMFVIVTCFNQLSAEEIKHPLSERIAITMKHAGVSITVTTFTDVLSFLIGSITVLPCLQSFCIYAALGVFLTLLYVATFFVACFTIDQTRIENNIGAICFWKRYPNYNPNKCSQAGMSHKLFNFIYSKIILTKTGKIVVILITSIFLGISFEGMLALEQRYDSKWFIPKETYLGQYFIQKNTYFPAKGFEGNVYIGAVNYSHEFVNIYKLVKNIKSHSGIIQNFNSWSEPFREYVKLYFLRDLYSETLSDYDFHWYLSKFLFSPKGAIFQGNFKFQSELKCGQAAPNISMSKIDFRFVTFTGPKEHIPAMRQIIYLSKQANFTTGDRFSTAWARIFGTWTIDEVISSEVLRNVGLAVVAVLVCTFLLIANIQICFWVFICITLSIINVCGFMHRWGLTVDLVTCIALQLAIGLCVDYATHIGFTFLTIHEGTRNERAIKTVTYIGPAVLYGGASTLIAVFMLGFSEAYNFQAFFKIFLLEVLFGLYHGVVFLPVVLSWIGPNPYTKYFVEKKNSTHAVEDLSDEENSEESELIVLDKTIEYVDISNNVQDTMIRVKLGEGDDSEMFHENILNPNKQLDSNLIDVEKLSSKENIIEK